MPILTTKNEQKKHSIGVHLHIALHAL